MAQWTTAYINDLPDSAFLYIEPGGDKDGEGKTVPRSLRHFPYKDSSGTIDMPHLRNAAARIPQSDLPQSVKERLQARCAELIAQQNQKSDELEQPLQDDLLTLSDIKTLDLPDSQLETLSIGQRVLGLMAVPYDVVAESRYGKIMFKQGAFGDVDPTQVRLRMDHADPPTGLGRKFEDRPDGAHLEFKLSKTQRADDQLQLARDGVSRGASVGFVDVMGAPTLTKIDGELVTVYGPNSAHLAEVSTTWIPTFAGAGVTYMLNKEIEVTETVEPQPQTAAPQTSIQLMAPDTKHFDDRIEKVLGAFDDWKEQMRGQIMVPAQEPKSQPKFLSWLTWAMKKIVNEPMTEVEMKKLDLADVLLVDQNVPAILRPEVVAFVNNRRPFLGSTTQVAPPDYGTALTIPVVTQLPTAGVQSSEKALISSQALKIENATITAETIAGGVDVSYQFIRRAPATYFDLLRRALFAAYAAQAESEAIDHLLDGIVIGNDPAVTPQDGGTLDPENLVLGDAWSNTMDVAQEPPDTMWLSPAAWGAFLDAKATTTNAPLYGNLGNGFNANTQQGGPISGLRTVLVPALTSAGVDVIVGPSGQFAWAEDGTFELQADKPSILGRDIALAGIMFFMPLAPAAFTTYVLTSS